MPMSPEKHARIEKITREYKNEHPEVRLHQLALECALDPDGATDEQRAAHWELEYRRLAKRDEELRTWFAKKLGCPAVWEFIQNYASTHIK